MKSRSEISALLGEAKLEISDVNEEKGTWDVVFDVQGKRQVTSVLHGDDFLLLVSFLESAKLIGKNLDELPAEVLRTIIREESAVDLAKFFFHSPSLVVVVSELYDADPQLSAAELRARLEACALLAAKLDLALA
jgi:hypothetical protein